jgi:hypothetical protein
MKLLDDAAFENTYMDVSKYANDVDCKAFLNVPANHPGYAFYESNTP